MEKIKKYQKQDTNNLTNKTHNIKRLLLIIIAIFLAIVTFEANKSYGAEATITNGSVEQTWEYSLSGENATLTKLTSYKINDEERLDSIGTLSIPSTIDGYTVTGIGNGTDRIINPDSYHNSDYKGVKELIIPSSIRAINAYAFESFTRLTYIKFEAELGLVNIGNYAFKNAINLNASSIGSNPKVMYKLALPLSLNVIGEGAFEMNPGYQKYYSTGDEILPYSSTATGWRTWNGIVGNFMEVELGNNVSSIGNFAFAGCNLLMKINIPRNTQSIGTGAFSYCSNLRNVTYDSVGNTVYLQPFAFSNIKYGAEELVIPSRVVLNKKVFYKNSKLKKVTLQGTGLNEDSFAECESLEEVVLPNTITSIPNKAFYICKNLKKITAPGVTSIGTSAFQGDENLEEIEFSGAVTVSNYSFTNCKKITTQTYNSMNVTGANTYSFMGCTGLTGTIQVNFVPGLGTFSKCTNIEKAILTGTMSYVSMELFEGCTKLAEVEIPSTVTQISSKAFSNCTSLTVEQLTENILPNITKISESAFQGDIGLEGEFTMSEILEEIGDYAFYGTKLTQINFNTKLKKLGTKAIPQTGEVIRIPSTQISSISTNAFTGVREAFFQVTSRTFATNWNGASDVITHFKNCKHTIKVENNLEGVKIINKETGEEITNNQFDCESDVTIKLQIEEGYSYPNIAVKMISQGQYASSALTRAFIVFDENNEYTISNITRNKTLIIQENENQTDLVLKKYISKINGEELQTNRKPEITTTRKTNNLDSINYSKISTNILVKKDDKITYTINVYNEGDTAGKANKIKVYLPDGIELAQNDETNTEYNWQVEETTEKGTIISSNYLSEKTIPAYRGEGKTEYEEIEVVCTLTKEEKNYLSTIAELAESNDYDSKNNNITIDDVFSDGTITNLNAQTKANAEDDSDFENLAIKRVYKVGYTIALEKIDSTSLELLNGAKFNLYNEDMELIESQVTVNDGKLEFNEQITYGEGIDIYYIEEVETPAGYTKTIDGVLELEVHKTINTDGTASLKIICEVSEEFDFGDRADFIPITTVEQLKKIGSSEIVTIDEENIVFSPDAKYKLENDIDLTGINWVPIEEFHGVLDGNGHKIKNLTIHQDHAYGYGANYIGFFEKLRGGVENLEFENVDIELTQAADFNVGAIAGYAGYQGNTEIVNCKVSGNINIPNIALGNNIGGFIGHTFSGTVVKMKNCTNTANVTGGNNTGGLIGTAKGNIELVDCVNKGTITGNIYSAGGLVGTAYPTGRTPENIVVGYDVANAKITIAIKNKKTITGKYNLILEKIDILQGIYLNGAKFNIYDEDMDIMQEGAIAVDGKLKISDIVINSLKSDVFYVKEVQAPEGYDIRVKDYVKVVVTKKWNSAKEKYEIDIQPSVVADKTETKQDYIKTNTEIISDFTDSEYVIWKDCRVRASNCSNEGNVSVVSSNNPLSDAGGIFGSVAEGDIDIYDCTNTGIITSRQHAGGIIGLVASAQGRQTRIIRSTNGVEGDTENRYCVATGNTGATGGIIGFSSNDTIMKDCVNYSKLSGENHIGGIIGVSLSRDLNIYDCTNYGDISYIATSQYGTKGIGGILGIDLRYTSLSMKGISLSCKDHIMLFDNCKSLGNMSNNGTYCMGGIVGKTYGYGLTYGYMTISNCVVGGENENNVKTMKNTNEYGNNVQFGGLVGDVDLNSLTLTNNTVKNLKAESNMNRTHFGGLLGVAYERGTNVKATDNTIENLTTQITNINQSTSSGIIGHMYSGTITLDNNIVKNSRITIGSNQDGRTQTSSGFIAYACNVSSIIITNCKMIDTDIIQTEVNSSSYTSMGGFIGIANGGYTNIVISDCEIKSTGTEKHKIEHTYSSKQESNTSALIGAYDIDNGGSVTIANNKISNIDININLENIGNTLGGNVSAMIAFSRRGGIGIYNNTLEGITINSNAQFNFQYATAGLCVGELNDGNVTIETNKVKNCTINCLGSAVGGLLGCSLSSGNISINKLEMENIAINQQSFETFNNHNSAYGGVIGHTTQSNVDMKNINVDGLEIKLVNGEPSTVGGLIGCFTDSFGTKKASFTGIDMKNVKFDCDMKKTSDYGSTSYSIGGLIGTAKLQYTVTGVTVDNLEIESNNSNVGSIVGHSGSEATIYAAQVSNIKLKDKAIETKQPSIGGIVGVNTSSIDITNSTVENAEIIIQPKTSANIHVGGIIGVNSYTATIRGVKGIDTVKNIKILNNSNGYAGGIIGLVASGATLYDTSVTNIQANGNYAIGGIVGGGSPDIYDAIVKNIDVGIEDESGITSYTKIEHVGGILGLGYGNPIVKGCTVTADENTEHVLFSNFRAGGITGFNWGTTEDCTVENITVKSNRNYFTSEGIMHEEEVTEDDIDTEEPTESSETETEEEVTENEIDTTNGVPFKPAAPINVIQYAEPMNTIVRNVKTIYLKNGVETTETYN